MKVTPVSSTAPRLLAHANSPTETLGYSVQMEIIWDPKDGCRYLTLGVGGAKRTQRAKLTKSQVVEMIVKLQPLAMML
jgi:hypothetical protein